MPFAMLSREKFAALARVEGVKKVWVLDTPALRLIRMGTETIDGVRTPTQFNNDRSAVEKATAEDADIGGVPKPEPGTGMYWTIGGNTKYLITHETGIWALMQLDAVVVVVPLKGTPDAKELMETIGKDVQVPPIALPVKTFCFYAFGK
jgi:hypothetical protein